jgi:tetratricopeptide (TPR) repeat protein
MFKKITSFVIILLVYSTPAYSLDWKVLHEQADNLSLTEASQALNKDSRSVSKKYTLGLVYLRLHQDQAADEIFHQLSADDPDLIQAKWGQAEVLRRGHKSSAAEKLLDPVIKTDPYFAPALVSLAYVRYFQMDFISAVRLALKIIQGGRQRSDLSSYARAYALYAGAKGMLAHYGGIFSKAIDGLAVKPNLEKARKLQPDSPAVLFGLGSFYLLAPAAAGGDPSLAKDYFDRAIKIDPLFADAYLRLAQLAKNRGDQEKYNFYLNKTLEIDPGNELAQDILSGSCKFICLDPKR